MKPTTLFTIIGYSKNIFFECPYEIQVKQDKMQMYKNREGNKVFKYQYNYKIYNSLQWITTSSSSKIIITGFKVDINKKKKTFYSRDYESLSKLYKFLCCKCAFYNIEDFYTIKNEISRGSSGRVFKIINKTTGKEFAAKQIKKKNLVPLNYSLLEQEINIMTKLVGDSHFVQIQDLFQNDESYFIVMNYLEGNSLMDFLKEMQKQNQSLSLSSVLKLMRRLIECLQSLYQLQIIHRDLKPSNLVFSEKNNLNSLTIIDFGFATPTNLNRFLLYKCGTPGYVAPEILNSDCQIYSQSCDIFSAGCIFYEILFGKSLFNGKNTQQIIENNRQCAIKFDETVGFPIEILDLLQNMLAQHVQDRITIKDALSEFIFQEQINQENETDDCQDLSPVVNLLPVLESQVGRIFEQQQNTNLTIGQ